MMKASIEMKSNSLLKDLTDQKREMNEIMVSEIHKTLDIIESDAKKYSPVRSGTLRDNMEVVKTEIGGQVLNLTPYAPYVELGTIYIQAQPFLRPAYRKNVDKLFVNIKKRVK